MPKKQKLSLYIKSADLNKISYQLSEDPDELYSDGDEHVIAVYNIPNNKIFKFSITVNKLTVGEHLLLEKIILDDEQLNYIDLFGLYHTAHGIKRTNGYMDEVGTYCFKIKFNFLTQNYLNFLLNK